jgi:5-hydroxyisourate hydrolase
MSAITTHVLDTSRGCPAGGIEVRLERGGTTLGRGTTNRDGRLRTLLEEGVPAEPGEYRLVFETGAYFAALGVPAFHPRVSIDFSVRDAGHHHVPLLLAPFGYSTYRGS